MLKLAEVAALVAATIAMGIMTGVFHLYAYAIMPGLGKTDDRTFVGAFQSIDRAIINPLFMATFFGALVFTAWPCCCCSAGTGARCCPGSRPGWCCTRWSSSSPSRSTCRSTTS
jgi:hypothetical protein